MLVYYLFNRAVRTKKTIVKNKKANAYTDTKHRVISMILRRLF